jgi:6-pyruvoyltetrahydropterin/6-carboxytetrahydropterin synthase
MKDDKKKKLLLGINIEKKHVVCTAHRLKDHPGACQNLHGHNYVLSFQIETVEFDRTKTGMVMDFATVKEHVCAAADYFFDHKTVLQKSDPLVELLEPVLKKNLVLFDDYPPTAENMATFLLLNINSHLTNTFPGVFLSRVTVEETPNNSATVLNTGGINEYQRK